MFLRNYVNYKIKDGNFTHGVETYRDIGVIIGFDGNEYICLDWNMFEGITRKRHKKDDLVILDDGENISKIIETFEALEKAQQYDIKDYDQYYNPIPVLSNLYFDDTELESKIKIKHQQYKRIIKLNRILNR